MGEKKIGNYKLVWWVGDHTPKHMHVFKDRKCVAIINVKDCELVSGALPGNVLKKIKNFFNKEFKK